MPVELWRGKLCPACRHRASCHSCRPRVCDGPEEQFVCVQVCYAQTCLLSNEVYKIRNWCFGTDTFSWCACIGFIWSQEVTGHLWSTTGRIFLLMGTLIKKAAFAVSQDLLFSPWILNPVKFSECAEFFGFFFSTLKAKPSEPETTPALGRAACFPRFPAAVAEVQRELC